MTALSIVLKDRASAVSRMTTMTIDYLNSLALLESFTFLCVELDVILNSFKIAQAKGF
jgi:hypothetical protein